MLFAIPTPWLILAYHIDQVHQRNVREDGRFFLVLLHYPVKAVGSSPDAPDAQHKITPFEFGYLRGQSPIIAGDDVQQVDIVLVSLEMI